MATKSKAPGRIGSAMVNVAAEVPPDVVTATLTAPAVAIRLAGTDAVSWLGLTYVAVSAVPSQFTVAPETKFVPFTVRVKAAPPAVAEEGERLLMVGTWSGAMVSVRLLPLDAYVVSPA
jgi:hypothetical protein